MGCRIRLCGPPSVSNDGVVVEGIRHKTIALVAYLSVEPGPKRRETLAALLWPSSGQAAAHGNLRSAIHDAARVLPTGVLNSNVEGLSLLPSPDLRVDVWQFRQAMSELSAKDEDIDRLSNAARICDGEFLEGFTLRDCSEFDFWQLTTAETLRRQNALLLSRLVIAQLAAGAALQAVESVAQLLSLDPLEEESHRLAMQAYARCGRWATALEQFEECRRILKRELDTEPEAETTVLAEEIRQRAAHLYKSGGAGSHLERGIVAPPVRRTSFFGRERELSVLEQLLASDCRLLTIAGPAGIGKTRIALEIASINSARYPDGIAFADLTATRVAADVPRIIGASVGMQQRVSLGDEQIRAISEHLTGRRLLVLLDNFEHVIEGAVSVARLVEQSETVQFLVTSREPLHVQGEVVVRLSPLAVPPADAGSEIRSSPAVRLFIDRAKRQDPELDIGQAELESIRSVCSSLDGLPLALELAVPLLRVYSLAELPQRLSHPLDYLERGGRDFPERQRTLEQAIEWSYSLLPPPEQEVLIRLSCLANGFDMDAAQAVSADSNPRAFRSSFIGLLDKSLVYVATESPVKRFALLESTRDFAIARGGNKEGRESVKKRHAEYYRALALEAEGELHGPDQVMWLNALDAGHPNLLEALRHMYESGDYVAGLETAAALSWYWYRRGQYRVGLDQTSSFLEPTTELISPLRAQALHDLGFFTFLVGDWRGAHYLYAQSLHLSRLVDDPICEQLALSDLAVVERWLGDTESGTRNAEAGVAVARDRGTPLSLARALVWAYATTGGLFADSYPKKELEEAADVAGKIGDLWLVAHAHNGLGDLHCVHGNTEDARDHYDRALRGFLELNDRYLAAWTFEGMGRVEEQCGNRPEALQRTFDALSLFDSLGDDLNVGLMICRIVGLLEGTLTDSERAVIAGAAAALINSRRSTDLTHTPQVDEGMGYLGELDKSHPDEWRTGSTLKRATAVVRARAFVQAAVPVRSDPEEEKFPSG